LIIQLWRRFVNERLHFPATAVLEIARLRPGQTVLDVATGTGIAAFSAAEVAGKSGEIVATDISPHMLDRARERLASFQNSSFSIQDGQAPSFPDQSFDAVICNMGLMYFPEPDKGTKEFYRVLRKMAARQFPFLMGQERFTGCPLAASSRGLET
jgi:ubiquinone/menaquinone biosynthesis C-methylase UbiE